MSFAEQVGAWAAKTAERSDRLVRKLVLDVGTRLVQRSPVGDPSSWQHGAPAGYTGGHFRANWQLGIGDVPKGYLPAIDKSGAVSLARIEAGLPKEAAGRVFFLANNLPYAKRLETGWSKQAPGGMVGVTVREFQGIVDKLAKELR